MLLKARKASGIPFIVVIGLENVKISCCLPIAEKSKVALKVLITPQTPSNTLKAALPVKRVPFFTNLAISLSGPK